MGGATQAVHRRSPEILRYIHEKVDPLNANKLQGMDDMQKAIKGHYYDPRGSSGSPELLSYRTYEHNHDWKLRLHEHLDSSNLILPRGFSREEIHRITQYLQKGSRGEYLPAKHITEEQYDVIKKIQEMFNINPEGLRRLTVDSFPDQLMRIINDSYQGKEIKESTLLISPYSISDLPDSEFRYIIGPHTSKAQDIELSSAPTVLSVKGGVDENSSSKVFNGSFDLTTNNFTPASSSGRAGIQEEELFHQTLEEAQEKIHHDVSLIQKINQEAASQLRSGLPSILRINPFKK